MTDRTSTGDVAPVATATAPTGDEGAPAMTNLAAQLDTLRIAVGEVDALAAVTVESFDNASWCGTDPLQVERMAHLLGTISKAATTALAVVERFHAFVADRQRADAGDFWSDE